MNEIWSNKRIALIWNSPNLDSTNYWKDIDSHDIVIRLNTWIIPKKLNKNTTWIKTDIWWTWALNAICNPDVVRELKSNKYKFKKILLWIPETPYDDSMYFKYLYLIYLKLYNHDLYFTPDSLYYKLANETSIWEERSFIPSTWFTFFMTLINYLNNNELSLYWFTFDTTHRILKEEINPAHNFEKEKEITLDIIEKNENITLYK